MCRSASQPRANETQTEPLTFGGPCVVSNVCGCAGFLRDVAAGGETRNVIIANYTELGDCQYADLEDLLQIDRRMRDHLEAAEGVRVAQEVLNRLPKNDAELDTLIYEGHRLAHNMSWDVVVRKYLLNDLTRIAEKQTQTRQYLRAS